MRTSQSVQVGTGFPKEMYNKHKRCMSVWSEERRVVCISLPLSLCLLFESLPGGLCFTAARITARPMLENWVGCQQRRLWSLDCQELLAWILFEWLLWFFSFFFLDFSEWWLIKSATEISALEALLMPDSIKILRRLLCLLESSFPSEAGSKLKAYLTTSQTRDVEEELGSSDPHGDSERISFSIEPKPHPAAVALSLHH